MKSRNIPTVGTSSASSRASNVGCRMQPPVRWAQRPLRSVWSSCPYRRSVKTEAPAGIEALLTTHCEPSSCEIHFPSSKKGWFRGSIPPRILRQFSWKPTSYAISASLRLSRTLGVFSYANNNGSAIGIGLTHLHDALLRPATGPFLNHHLGWL